MAGFDLYVPNQNTYHFGCQITVILFCRFFFSQDLAFCEKKQHGKFYILKNILFRQKIFFWGLRWQKLHPRIWRTYSKNIWLQIWKELVQHLFTVLLLSRGLMCRICSEQLLKSCSNGSFLECSPPTAEAQVRFSAGTCQSWDLQLWIEMTVVKSL